MDNTLSDYDLIDRMKKERQNEIDKLRSENERLQVDNTELKSLLLWALEHINIPFYLFDENDQRNIWHNRVTEVTK